MSAIASRLQAVRDRIARAARDFGRSPREIGLLAVSKTWPVDCVIEAKGAGQRSFGENYVQEGVAKVLATAGLGLEWHFIGHLQTNKVAAAVALFSTIHSVDSLRVLNAVEQAAAAAGVRVKAMLEVNVSGERSKFGLPPEEVPGVLERGAAYSVSASWRPGDCAEDEHKPLLDAVKSFALTRPVKAKAKGGK